jgi:DNA-binding NtrC family response regulator
VTATNRNLPLFVRQGKFREDLFMRLNVVQMRVPSLREHKEDIRDIADGWWFARFRRHLADAQVSALMSYDYPGNVRELQNSIARAYYSSAGSTLTSENLVLSLERREPEAPADATLLPNAGEGGIIAALTICNGDVDAAAERLGISRATLYRRMKKYGIIPRLIKQKP